MPARAARNARLPSPYGQDRCLRRRQGPAYRNRI